MNCHNCGAALSLDDMTRPNCPYCRSVLAHHARAAEQAALVNQVLQQQFGAQVPGQAPPQIGYQYGAGLAPGPAPQAYQQFALQQIDQSVRRMRWIIVVAVIVPIVLLAVIGGVVAWLVM